MKTIRSEDAIKKAIKLKAVIDQRRELEKAEAELKDFFKAKAEGEEILKVGTVVITFTECERTSLDRKALEAEFGAEKISIFDKITTYIKTEVKGG